MAKAILGHVGAVNIQRLSVEAHRLRARIAELEAELTRAQSAPTTPLERFDPCDDASAQDMEATLT